MALALMRLKMRETIWNWIWIWIWNWKWNLEYILGWGKWGYNSEEKTREGTNWNLGKLGMKFLSH